MIKMKFITGLVRCAGAILTVGFLATGATAREAVPIIDYIDVPIITSTGKPITSDQARDAITVGALSKRWEIGRSPSQDLLSATLQVRGKHTVVVTIPYSTEKFSIRYQNSINMKYGLADPVSSGSTDIHQPIAKNSTPQGTPTIHPFYNNWVRDLLQAIQAELRKL